MKDNRVSAGKLFVLLTLLFTIACVMYYAPGLWFLLNNPPAWVLTAFIVFSVVALAGIAVVMLGVMTMVFMEANEDDPE